MAEGEGRGGEEGERERKRRRDGAPKAHTGQINGDLRELERAWIGLSTSLPGASKQV